MKRRAIFVGAWTTLATLLAVVACEPETAPGHLFAEDFETECDGTPCGWSMTSDGPGLATWVETIHPGEHGLRLAGDVTVRGPAAREDAQRLRGNAVTVHVANACDIGNALSVTVVIEEDTGALHDATVMVRTEPTWTNPGQELRFDMDTIRGGSVVAIVLDKDGPGICDIGDITVDFMPLCMEGCC